MKKKYSATSKDKNDWIAFTKRLANVYDKENDVIRQNARVDRTQRLDLHGLSLSQANKIVKKFIILSFEEGYKKLLIITGKGLRSQVHKNPYLSKQMNVLKYSVPEFIKNDDDLFDKISKLSIADLKDGGKGAFYIFLKQKKSKE